MLVSGPRSRDKPCPDGVVLIYDCLFHNGVFLIAKPFGWAWSHNERQAPFETHVTGELESAESDYKVEINGVTIMASEIDPCLVMGAI